MWSSICLTYCIKRWLSPESSIRALFSSNNRKRRVIWNAAVYSYFFRSCSPIGSPVTLHSSRLTRNRMCSRDSGVPKTVQSFIPLCSLSVCFGALFTVWSPNGTKKPRGRGKKVITWRWLDVQLDLIFLRVGRTILNPCTVWHWPSRSHLPSGWRWGDVFGSNIVWLTCWSWLLLKTQHAKPVRALFKMLRITPAIAPHVLNNQM